MKPFVFFATLVISSASIAAENCKPIHDAPASVSVSSKDGLISIEADQIAVKGNAGSPIQPAEKLQFVAGAFSFLLVPVSSCADGLLLDFQKGETTKQSLVPWGKPTTIDGVSGSQRFITVSAKKLK